MHEGAVPLAGFRAPGAPAGPTYVYIEGDGAAWLSRSRLSADPTPRDPVALRLALNHPAPGALYAARPCQYVSAAALARCDPALWSGARWSEAVVAAMSAALSHWKRSPDERFVLAGWSGGGVVAALLAARRDDADGLITVAAPLDAAAWTAHHGVSPLAASLDPAAEPPDRRAPALHLHGGRDATVPPSVIEAYRRAAPPNARFVVVPAFGHRCCWPRAWPRLLREAALPSGRGATARERGRLARILPPAAAAPLARPRQRRALAEAPRRRRGRGRRRRGNGLRRRYQTTPAPMRETTSPPVLIAAPTLTKTLDSRSRRALRPRARACSPR